MDALEHEYDLLELKDQVSRLRLERDELKLALERSQTETKPLRAKSRDTSTSVDIIATLGIDDLRQYVRELEMRTMAEKENWHRESMDMHDMIRQLQFDKEELVRFHTQESGELRKKVSFLIGRIEICRYTIKSILPEAVSKLIDDEITESIDELEQPQRPGEQDVAAVVTVQDFEANAFHDRPTPHSRRRKIELKAIKDDRTRSV